MGRTCDAHLVALPLVHSHTSQPPNAPRQEDGVMRHSFRDIRTLGFWPSVPRVSRL